MAADPSQGKLVTGLVPPPSGRTFPSALQSEFIITDGQWRHIGFVWDGSRRYLYVDGAEFARYAASCPTGKVSSTPGEHEGNPPCGNPKLFIREILA